MIAVHLTPRFSSPAHCNPSVALHLLVVALERGGFAPGAVQVVQLAERAFRPNAETPNVAPRGESQQVQLVHIEKSNSCRETDKPTPSICD